MLLIGQYDSPFVRRVAIALTRYELAFEHRPWSVWGDAEKIAEYNPLRRVPTLVLDDGSVLCEAFVILDTLDELVGDERRLLPRSGATRRDGLRIAGLCSGLADKAVSLLYERLFRGRTPSNDWVERCRSQIAATLGVLESDRASRSTQYWFGNELSHADIAFACAFRFLDEAHEGGFELAAFPSLSEHSTRCENLPEFRAVYQPITNVL